MIKTQFIYVTHKMLPWKLFKTSSSSDFKKNEVLTHYVYHLQNPNDR